MHPLLLDARISVSYRRPGQILKDIDLRIARGEVVGLIGASGCGKSTLARAVLNLPSESMRVSGYVRFKGRDLLEMRRGNLRRIRGSEIGYVPQSPAAALNPALTVQQHLTEAWRAHKPYRHRQALPRLVELLSRVNLPGDAGFLQCYPNQLSVGQAQRLLIGMGIMHNPELLIADEPTSALDAVTHADILQLFRRLANGLKLGMLVISHDLSSIHRLCHRVLILHDGIIVEEGSATSIFAEPTHPYTRSLMDACRYQTVLPADARAISCA